MVFLIFINIQRVILDSITIRLLFIFSTYLVNIFEGKNQVINIMNANLIDSLVGFIKEPLFHFLIVSLIIYAGLSQQQQSIEITLDEETVSQFLEKFSERSGRQPTAIEVANFKEHWITEEALYLKGLELELDQHDSQIRQLIVNKMYKLIQDTIVLNDPEDQELRAFYLDYGDQYKSPDQFSFGLVRLDNIEDPEEVLSKLNHAENQFPVRWFQNKNEAYVQAALSSVLFEQIQSNSLNPGWFYVRDDDQYWFLKVTDYVPSEIPRFEEIEARVAGDWKRLMRQNEMKKQLEVIVNEFNTDETGLNI